MEHRFNPAPMKVAGFQKNRTGKKAASDKRAALFIHTREFVGEKGARQQSCSCDIRLGEHWSHPLSHP